jgi:hypothetical protein
MMGEDGPHSPMMSMSRVMRFPTAVERDPAIEAWMGAHAGPLGAIARRWFEVMIETAYADMKRRVQEE